MVWERGNKMGIINTFHYVLVQKSRLESVRRKNKRERRTEQTQNKKTGKETRKQNERRWADKRWNGGRERWMAYQTNANLLRPTVITLVYASPLHDTHTENAGCKSILPMLIEPMKKSTVGMW